MRAPEYLKAINHLNEKFKELVQSIDGNDDSFKKNIALYFFLAMKTYFNLSSNINIFMLLFGFEPILLLYQVFTDEDIKVNEFKQFMNKIYIVYKRVCKYIENLRHEFHGFDMNKYYIPMSYFLKECILLKWMIEVERIHLFNSVNEWEKSNHMLIYSINANDSLVGELSSFIKNVIDAKSDEELKLFGLYPVPSQKDSMHRSYNYTSYEFYLSNKKRYITKIFELEKCDYLPSGISTAYLNHKDGFEYLGYMGVVKISKSEFKYLFLSIEEYPSFYLYTYELTVFKNNVVQAFYFLLYILELLSSLDEYNTGRMDNIRFAVNNNDSKKWKFIIENTGDFVCFRNKNLINNNLFLKGIFDNFSEFFINRDLKKFFKELSEYVNLNNDRKDKPSLVFLTAQIENKLKTIEFKSEPIDILENECSIQ